MSWIIQVGVGGPFWAVMEGMGEAACLPATARTQMTNFSSTGHALSQSLATTTDTPARRRKAHVMWSSDKAHTNGGRVASGFFPASLCSGEPFQSPEENSRLLEWKSEYYINSGREPYLSQIKKEWKTNQLRVKKFSELLIAPWKVILSFGGENDVLPNNSYSDVSDKIVIGYFSLLYR